MDGVDILLDGVCGEVPPYLPTPPSAIDVLKQNPADVVAFTHLHPDHYDEGFVRDYQKRTGKRVMLPGCDPVQVRTVKITPFYSRHLGKMQCAHVSYIIESGESCVWFTGDASPIQWKGRTDIPRPDIMIVPFAYANTQTSWHQMCALKPGNVIIVHMPEKDADQDQIWDLVESVIAREDDVIVCIPEIMEKITIL